MQRFTILLIFSALVLFSIFSTGCSNEADKSIKKDILKNESPEKAKKKKAVPLTDIDMDDLAEGKEEMEKLIIMPQSEVAERLGSYVFNSKVSYLTKRKEKDLDLSDNYFLESSKNGDFHLYTFNDKVKKRELYYIDGKIYDLMNESGFRETNSAGMQNFWREKIYGALSRYYLYFRGHLNFSDPAPVTYEGRPALRVEVSLDPSGQTPEDDLKLKFRFPNQYLLSARSINLMINKNRKRVSRFEAASGHIIVDKEAGAIVSFQLHGKYAVPISEKQITRLKNSGNPNPSTEVIFTTDITYDITKIGDDIVLKVPQLAPSRKRTPPMEPAENVVPKGTKVNDTLKPNPEHHKKIEK